jgi:hypothetical protein
MVDRQELYRFYVLSHARRFIPDGSDPPLHTAGALGVWDSRDERRALRTIAEVETEVRRLEGDPGADVAAMTRELEQARRAVEQARHMEEVAAKADREARAVLDADPNETTAAAARRLAALVPEMRPTERDERQRREAAECLQRLILADGKTDTGDRWLHDAAADEIVRLRAELSGARHAAQFPAHDETRRVLGAGREEATSDAARRVVAELDRSASEAKRLRGELAEANERALRASHQFQRDEERLLDLSRHERTVGREQGAAEMRERAAAWCDGLASRERHSVARRALEMAAYSIRGLRLDGAPAKPHPLDADAPARRRDATTAALMTMGLGLGHATAAARIAEEEGAGGREEAAHEALLSIVKPGCTPMLEGELRAKVRAMARQGAAGERAAARFDGEGGLSAEDAETLRGAGWRESGGIWYTPMDRDAADYDPKIHRDLALLRVAAAHARAAKAPAAAHMGPPGKATGGEENATAGSGSVAEEPRGAQGAQSASPAAHAVAMLRRALWNNTADRLESGEFTPQRALATLRNWSLNEKTDDDDQAAIAALEALVKAPAAPAALPKPERVGLGQRWRFDEFDCDARVIGSAPGDWAELLFLDGGSATTVVAHSRLLTCEKWIFLGPAPTPRGPDGVTEKGDEEPGCGGPREACAMPGCEECGAKHELSGLNERLRQAREAAEARGRRVSELEREVDRLRGDLRVSSLELRDARDVARAETKTLPEEVERLKSAERRVVDVKIDSLTFAGHTASDEAKAHVVAWLTRELQQVGPGEERDHDRIHLLHNADGSVRVEMPKGADARAVLATVAELLGFKPQDAEPAPDREALGREVHEARRSAEVDVGWGIALPWEKRSDGAHEIDRRIGERIFAMGARHGRAAAGRKASEFDTSAQDLQAELDLCWAAIGEERQRRCGGALHRAVRDMAEELAARHEPGAMWGVYADILGERMAQDRKWGGPRHDDQHDASEWVGFIVDRASMADEAESGEKGDAEYRKRMVQIAALAVAAVESMDRYTSPGGERVTGSLLGTLWRLPGAPTQGAYEVVEHADGKVRIQAQHDDTCILIPEAELRDRWEQIDGPITPPAERYAAPGQDGGDAPAKRSGTLLETIESGGLFAAPGGRATPPLAIAAPEVPESHAGDAGAPSTPWRGLAHEARPARITTDGTWFAQHDRYAAAFDGPHAEERAREYAVWVSAPAGMSCKPVLAIGQERAADNGVWCSAHGGRIAEPAPAPDYRDGFEEGRREGRERAQDLARGWTSSAPMWEGISGPRTIQRCAAELRGAFGIDGDALPCPEDASEPAKLANACDRCGSRKFLDFCGRCAATPQRPAQVLRGQRWRCAELEALGDLEVGRADGLARGEVALCPVATPRDRLSARAADMLALPQWTFVSGPRE